MVKRKILRGGGIGRSCHGTDHVPCGMRRRGRRFTDGGGACR